MSRIAKHPESASPNILLFSPRMPIAADQRWKRLTRQGNVAFAAGRWADADALYTLALQEAERIFRMFRTNGPTHGVDAAPLLVVSVANATENWLAAREADQVADALLTLCNRLCGAVEDEGLSIERREQCCLHLRYALVELMDKLRRAGASNETLEREVDHVCAVTSRFLTSLSPQQ